MAKSYRTERYVSKARHVSKERSLPFHAPVRAWVLAEWALVPLRLFLGVTFVYAGLQKLANPNFFDSRSPISIHSQLIGAARVSPVHSLLTPLIGHATLVGLAIAFGEIAVGVGALLGLWTRVAALGGLILSLSLFLTVSFHASPYFMGADIVFFFAWIPFIVAGGGSRLSLDGFIANTAAKRSGLPSPAIVPIPFAKVQEICGHFEKGKCKARHGLACDAAFCPVLLGDRAPIATRVAIDTVDRRALVLGGAAAAIVGTSVLIIGGADAVTGKLIGGAPKPKGESNSLSANGGTTTTTPSSSTSTPTDTTTTVPSPGGVLLGSSSQVPLNQAASFTIPSNGDPGIVIHTQSGEFLAYDAVCPHTGCPVGYSSTAQVIVCPCHGSQFEVANGNVIVGPAPHGLTKLKIVEGANGNLYLQ
jgi:thiosulfate dehydrogenase [quinone] large subunit